MAFVTALCEMKGSGSVYWEVELSVCVSVQAKNKVYNNLLIVHCGCGIVDRGRVREREGGVNAITGHDDQ